MKKITLITTIILTANLLFGQLYNKIDTSFFSEALQEEKLVDVYFPPGYDENPDLYYPVIYYLHGWGGDQNSMNANMNWLQALINNGTVEPVIMVGADNSPEPFDGSMYVNSEVWGNYEDYMIDDLINWIDVSFRTIPDKYARALMGQSMGGYGSFRYGILHSDIFRVIASHGGELCFDIDLWLEPGRQEIILENQPGPPFYYDFYTDGLWTKAAFLATAAFAPNLNTSQAFINPPVADYFIDENGDFIDSVVAKWQEQDILKLIHLLSPLDDVGIFFGCGTEDFWQLYPGNIALKDSLDLLGLPYEFYSHNGGHNMPGGFKERAFTFIDSLLMGPLTAIDNIPSNANRLTFSVVPNPIKESASIQFTLNENAIMNLSIFDIRGKMVLSEELELKLKGKHQIPLSLVNLSEGIYFCRVQFGNEMVTKKIIKL